MLRMIARSFCIGAVLVSMVAGTTLADAPSPTPAASAAPAASSTVTVPGGTDISVAVTDKVSSATANVGDTFAVKATDDVVVNGWVVVAKGAGGQGEVVSVDRAGSHGHPGNLGLKMDWVYAVDGEKIRLTSQQKTEEGKGEQGVSSTMTIVSWAFLGLPGLFAHNWVKGHDVELDSSHPLKAYVDDTVHVVATTKSDAGSGFAH